MHKLTTEEFIEKANAVHNFAYDYSKTEYIGARSKLTVTCRLHGDWTVDAGSHISGRGCPGCKAVKVGNHNRSSKEDFVAKSIGVHGDRYDYSLVNYTKASDKVDIVCKRHGIFQCMPLDHHRGKGCPKCADHGYSIGRPGYLYVLSDGTTTKIGITNRSPEQRTKEIVRSSGLNFTKRFSIYFEDGSVAKDIESATLRMLRDTYKQPDNTYDGSTESFMYVDLTDLLTFINQRAS